MVIPSKVAVHTVPPLVIVSLSLLRERKDGNTIKLRGNFCPRAGTILSQRKKKKRELISLHFSCSSQTKCWWEACKVHTRTCFLRYSRPPEEHSGRAIGFFLGIHNGVSRGRGGWLLTIPMRTEMYSVKMKPTRTDFAHCV